MLNLNILKETRVYQEAKAEGREEGRQEGREEAKAEGREEGKEEGKLEIKLKMIPIFLELGLTVQQIAERLELDIEEVRKVLEEM